MTPLRVAMCAALLWTTGCAGSRHARSLPGRGARSFTLELPTSLERERPAYVAEIGAAVERVAAWFAALGYPVRAGELVRRAVVFDTRDPRVMARAFGIDEKQVPPNFAGTVVDGVLFVVTPALYKQTYSQLYPEFPWADVEYQQLIVHEVAHHAHELVARARFGSEDAMGPRWFFEGLALVCAEQFSGAPALGRDELARYISEERNASHGYPIYAAMVRALATRSSLRLLVERAATKDFETALLAEWSR